ncbi:hypothetical protein [Pseudorhodoplanes sp.]|uniref:hypothetical protein n=1 Tax=Pseudorhodoplanes sp. TaxID=1934341 RepID=UPI003D13F8BF
MNGLLNIERSGFRAGELVGYGGRVVWRIRRSGYLWTATSAISTVSARSLKSLSAALLQFDEVIDDGFDD